MKHRKLNTEKNIWSLFDSRCPIKCNRIRHFCYSRLDTKESSVSTNTSVISSDHQKLTSRLDDCYLLDVRRDQLLSTRVTSCRDCWARSTDNSLAPAVINRPLVTPNYPSTEVGVGAGNGQLSGWPRGHAGALQHWTPAGLKMDARSGDN